MSGTIGTARPDSEVSSIVWGVGAALLWTALIGASLLWDVMRAENESMNLARDSARAVFFKDLAIRLWASEVGGIYVPARGLVTPSPHLAAMPGRDATSADGVELTLLNPNRLLNEIQRNYPGLYGIRSRAVGIVTLDARNRADPWEESAIRAFENGADERIAEALIDGKPHLRLMRPLHMNESCLDCHGHLGFSPGDVRGGLGVTVPLEPYLAMAAANVKSLQLTHGVVWLVGLLGILAATAAARHNRRLREASIDELRLLAKVFRDDSQAILITNPGGLIERVNPGFTRLTDFPPDEALGRSPLFLIHEAQDTAAAALSAALAADLPWSGEARIRRRDGKPFPAQISISTVADDDGRTRYRICQLLDMSVQKAHEAALRQLNEELEQRVKRRTDQLLVAKDEAERASQAKTTFLSRMSHELRTPLNAILGFSQLLDSDTAAPLAADQRESVGEIYKAGQHLLALINEVLDLARADSGRLVLAIETVDLAELFAECIGLIRPRAEARDITIELERCGRCLSGVTIRTDRGRLRQVLMNLLSNAVKYNRDGGTITLSCRESGSERILIQVADTGCGIATESLPKLFQPFERIVASPGLIEGSGITLALTARLVRAMGGEIAVESNPDTGATFRVELPTACAQDVRAPYTESTFGEMPA